MATTIPSCNHLWDTPVKSFIIDRGTYDCVTDPYDALKNGDQYSSVMPDLVKLTERSINECLNIIKEASDNRLSPSEYPKLINRHFAINGYEQWANNMDVPYLPGALFGLGLNRSVDLLCRVISIQEDGMKFDVLNGAWVGFYKLDGTVEFDGPSGFCSHNVTCKFFNKVPGFYYDDYNKILLWMNGVLTDEEIKPFLKSNSVQCGIDDFDDDIAF